MKKISYKKASLLFILTLGMFLSSSSFAAISAPPAPRFISALPESCGAVKFSWAPSVGGTSTYLVYKLFRRDSLSTSTYTQILSTSSTSFIDVPPNKSGTYAYYLKAFYNTPTGISPDSPSSIGQTIKLNPANCPQKIILGCQTSTQVQSYLVVGRDITWLAFKQSSTTPQSLATSTNISYKWTDSTGISTTTSKYFFTTKYATSGPVTMNVTATIGVYPIQTTSVATCSINVGVTKPLAPPALQAFTSDTCGAKIRLTWPEANGATGYNVYRSENQSTDFVKIADNFQGMDFTDVGILNKPNTTYFYRVYSVNAGGESSAFASASGVSSKGCVPGNPVTATTSPVGCGGGVNVSWTSGANATGYKIYRKSGTQIDYSFINDIQSATTTSFLDLVSGPDNFSYKITSYNNFGESSGKVSTINLPECIPDTGIRYSFDGDNIPVDEPVSFDDIDPLYHKERGELPPWIMLSSGGTDPVTGKVKNIKALMAVGPSPRTDENEQLIKAPLNIDGVWDGETYIYLFPDHSTPPIAKAGDVWSGKDGAVMRPLNVNGQNTYIWALPEEEGDNDSFPFTIKDPSPSEQIFFKVPYLFRDAVIDQTGGSYGAEVGPGTNRPIGFTLDELMKLYWRVKRYGYSMRGNYSLNWDDENGNWWKSALVNFDEELDVWRNSQYPGMLYSFSEKYFPTSVPNFSGGDSGTGKNNLQGNATTGYDQSHWMNWNLQFGNYSSIVKNGDLYYPVTGVGIQPIVFGNAGAWSGKFDEQQGMTISATPAVKIFDKKFPLYYISSETYGEGEDAYTINFSMNANLTVEPLEYWTYGGRYDSTTGEETSGHVFKSNDSLKGLANSIRERLVAGVSQIFNINNLGDSSVFNFFIKKNTLAKGGGSSSGDPERFRIVGARITHFGGPTDVRIDDKGYAWERNQNTGAFDRRANSQGRPILFRLGRKKGGIGFSETGAVSKKLLRLYDSEKDFYVAYPINKHLPRGARPESSSILQDYCMVVTNAKTGSYVWADIIDRGPGKSPDTIDASKAVINILGLDEDKDRVNATVVKKNSSGQCN